MQHEPLRTSGGRRQLAALLEEIECAASGCTVVGLGGHSPWWRCCPRRYAPTARVPPDTDTLYPNSIARIGVGRLQVGLLGPPTATTTKHVHRSALACSVVSLIAIRRRGAAGLTGTPQPPGCRRIPTRCIRTHRQRRRWTPSGKPLGPRRCHYDETRTPHRYSIALLSAWLPFAVVALLSSTVRPNRQGVAGHRHAVSEPCRPRRGWTPSGRPLGPTHRRYDETRTPRRYQMCAVVGRVAIRLGGVAGLTGRPNRQRVAGYRHAVSKEVALESALDAFK